MSRARRDGRDVRRNGGTRRDVEPVAVLREAAPADRSYGRNRADIQATLEWAAAGKLKPVIDSIYPLDRAGEAFAHLRSRNFLGKILVEPFEPASESD